jgi:ABC-type lipoprotein export system ATPase subunit
MLKSLRLKRFTVFHDSTLHFGRHLNVIVGENGTGKSHVLKAAYCGIAANVRHGQGASSQDVKFKLGEKFLRVFRPDELGRLVRRGQGRAKAELQLRFEDEDLNCEFSITTLGNLRLKEELKSRHEFKPVFLPPRELMTLGPSFVSLYETSFLPFEETWRDTCLLLGAPVQRGPRPSRINSLMAMIEKALGGRVQADESGRFYLANSSGRMEMHLVAEGLRKFAMLARLIASGSLLDKHYLFWDEPEANLNPKMTKVVASVILELAKAGVQVFLATHSLFLMRELHVKCMRSRFRQLDCRFFGLHFNQKTGVDVRTGTSLNEIGDIAALDEELLQADEFLEAELGIR